VAKPPWTIARGPSYNERMSHYIRVPRALQGLCALTLTLLTVAAPRSARAEAATTAVLASRVALVQVALPSAAESERLLQLGLDIINVRPGVWAQILARPGDEETLRAAGFSLQVLAADYGRALAIRNGITAKPAPPRTTATVPPFGSGSLAGFYTLAEINAYLDSISTHDPNGIVSPVVQIGTSWQGRPLRAVRIANEAYPDHSRPRVLFTCMTHAREPGGMQNAIYFINKLLAGYGTDPVLTYLVDQREIWFVLCVNPDGYKYDEDYYFNNMSYGLHRKNARDNNSSGVFESASDGVDLNRNYGYMWGYDNSGSSPTTTSDLYRGPSAFSEPETQAVRDFCILHGFRVAQNFHTYHEATLYGYAYNNTQTPDNAFFVRMCDEMVRDNHYVYGSVVEVLYAVNGDANDWMYGEQVAKPKAIAVTTEAGGENDGFWPSASRILPIAHQNYRSCIVQALAAGVFVHEDATALVSSDGWLHPHGDAQVALTLRNDGLDATSGNVTVTATTDAPGITITDPTSTFAPIASSGTATPAADDRIGIRAASSVTAGTIVPLYLEIRDAGAYVFRDTTRVTVGQPTTIFSDNASGGLTGWTSVGGWGIQTVGGNPLFSDSPAGNYVNNANARLTLNTPLDLSGGLKAYLTFTTQWVMEIGFDFGRVEVSTNGGTTWTAVAGRMTRPGRGTTGYPGGTQTLGAPGYDAAKRFMTPEVVDLSAYVGLSNVRLRFRLTADTGGNYDGWLIDDIKVQVYRTDITDVAADGHRGPAVTLAAASQNPFRNVTRLRATFATPTPFQTVVYAVDGRRVRMLGAGVAAAGTREFVWDGRDDAGAQAASGAYVVRLQSPAGDVTQRVVRIR
jgi:carboxypeptidase T